MHSNYPSCVTVFPKKEILNLMTNQFNKKDEKKNKIF